MIEESGRVVAVEDAAVWVETVRSSTCQSCNARHGCGHSLLERDRAGARARVRALSGDLRLNTGDQVVVGIPEGALMKGALMVYLLPISLLFIGALLGAWLSPPDLDLSAILGVAGLAVGFLVNRWYSRQQQANVHWQPKILRVIDASPMQAVSL